MWPRYRTRNISLMNRLIITAKSTGMADSLMQGIDQIPPVVNALATLCADYTSARSSRHFKFIQFESHGLNLEEIRNVSPSVG